MCKHILQKRERERESTIGRVVVGLAHDQPGFNLYSSLRTARMIPEMRSRSYLWASLGTYQELGRKEVKREGQKDRCDSIGLHVTGAGLIPGIAYESLSIIRNISWHHQLWFQTSKFHFIYQVLPHPLSPKCF